MFEAIKTFVVCFVLMCLMLSPFALKLAFPSGPRSVCISGFIYLQHNDFNELLIDSSGNGKPCLSQ